MPTSRSLAGSRHDLDGLGDARRFYAGLDLHEVDFTRRARRAGPDALRRPGRDARRCSRPSRTGRARPTASSRRSTTPPTSCRSPPGRASCAAAGAAAADVLHLHHLTPLNAAAARGRARRAGRRAPARDRAADARGDRARPAAAGRTARHGPRACAPGRPRRSASSSRPAAATGPPACSASRRSASSRSRTASTRSSFRPLEVDRRAVWRRALVDAPRGWRPGAGPGSVRYDAARARRARRAARSILYVGRFTEVKRLGLLLEAFADARARMAEPASLVLVGGHPGEWEGEHPADAIERLGLPDVLLAGWYDQSELPELLAAADLLVLPVGARELRPGDRRGDGLRRAAGRRGVARAGADHRRRRDGLAVRRRRPRRAHRRARRGHRRPARARAARGGRRVGGARALHVAGGLRPARRDPAPRRARRVARTARLSPSGSSTNTAMRRLSARRS